MALQIDLHVTIASDQEVSCRRQRATGEQQFGARTGQAADVRRLSADVLASDDGKPDDHHDGDVLR
jgi:hypothetical protein